VTSEEIEDIKCEILSIVDSKGIPESRVYGIFDRYYIKPKVAREIVHGMEKQAYIMRLSDGTYVTSPRIGGA
jgi:hypothetical protein